MDRRDLLKVLGVGAFAVLPTNRVFADNPEVEWYGVAPPHGRRRRVATFHERFRPFKGISTLGRNAFLYQNLQKELGDFDPHYQGPAEDGSPGEGDCVGQASALGCDILAATDVHQLKQRERWEAKASVEMNYAGGRIEIGQKNDPNGVNHLLGRGGSHGAWQAEYLQKFGVIHRKKYSDGENEIDLTGYHPARSRKYRDAGVPDWLEAIAKDHPVEEITQATSGREALDAVCAGQVVLMCSSYAFPDVRDADGFTKPYLGGTTKRGWRFVSTRRQWWHAMLLAAAILEGPRIGGTILNSHGEWNSGPRPNDLPRGGFNVELEYLDMMVKDWGDCWVLGSYKGHEAKKMRHRLFLR